MQLQSSEIKAAYALISSAGTQQMLVDEKEMFFPFPTHLNG